MQLKKTRLPGLLVGAGLVGVAAALALPDLSEAEKQVFLSFQDVPEWLVNALAVPMQLGTLWAGLLVAIAFGLGLRDVRAGGSIGAAVLLAWIWIQPLKELFDRSRPAEILSDVVIHGKAPHDLSFPSGHTSLAFALATSLALVTPRLGIPAFVLALLVGISRVAHGVHFPLDIVAGAGFGIACGCLANLVVYANHPSRAGQSTFESEEAAG